jgi:hypothetical protein
MAKVSELKPEKKISAPSRLEKTVTLTIGEIRDIWNGMARLANLIGVRFIFTIHANRERLREIAQPLEEGIKPSPDFKTFQQEYAKLRREYQDDTRPAPPDMEAPIDPARAEEYRIKAKALEEKNKDLLEQRQKQIEEFNELLQEKRDVIFLAIPVSKIPREITAGQVQLIMPMLQDDLEGDDW